MVKAINKKYAVLFGLLVAVLFFVSYIDTMQRFIFADSNEEPYSIFIIAGQSNAEGTNSFRSSLPAGTGFDKQDHPADLNTNFWWAGADGKGPSSAVDWLTVFNGQSVAGWMDSGSGIALNKLKNLNSTQRGGLFGSELGAGRALYDKGRRKVIILKVTYGFQSLAQSTSQFIPYDWNSADAQTRQKSYYHLKTEYDQLTEQLRSQGKKYTVDGFLWMQGETDTLQTEYAASYKQNLLSLTQAIRNDFKLHPAAHIVLGKISLKQCIEESYPLTGNYCGFPWAGSIDPLVFSLNDTQQAAYANRQRQVRDAMQFVADNDQVYTQKVDVVETGDLKRGYDSIHLTESSQLELGKRFVNMYSLPKRYNSDDPIPGRNTDYDRDGILNSAEDTGRGQGCPLSYNAANNGNLGDDDSDCDGFPNYLDKINGVGSGL
ncbi:MAG: hypothetical protein NTV95_02275 [Candidatus Saccharibacteria bacterium]|nr:hypothetical protein [Candidatus Saccharibacteria bacterium]